MSSNNVGFNITKINDLLEKVAKSYNQIGEAICNDWSAFDNIIRTNWIGPDEVSNENELIDNIYYLYEKCREGIDDIITQIVNIGDYWIDFQNIQAIQAVNKNKHIKFKEVVLKGATSSFFACILEV